MKNFWTKLSFWSIIIAILCFLYGLLFRIGIIPASPFRISPSAWLRATYAFLLFAIAFLLYGKYTQE